MGRFDYKAIGRGGEVLTGRVAADTREAAIEALRQSGVVPLHIDEARGPRSASLWPFAALRRRAANERDLMLFSRELGILLAAGVPIDRALTTLGRIVSEGPMQGLADELLTSIRSGQSLGDALEKRSDVFPAFYVGMVRAGEAGGSLVPVMERLTLMLERSEALRASIRSALVYPVLVLVLTGLSLVVLLAVVIPEFRPVFEDAGMEPPLSTRIVLGFSDLVTERGWALALALLAGLVALRQACGSETGRRRIDGWILSLPVFGPLVRRIETARFARSLGTLRANGVALVDAVGVAAGTLKNRQVAEAARRIAGPLAKGEGLAAPMRRSGCFPPLALQLIEVGEESGRLEEMLLQVAEVYDKEVERSLQRALALLTPTLTILLGCLIAFIIGSILSAILGSYDIAL